MRAPGKGGRPRDRAKAKDRSKVRSPMRPTSGAAEAIALAPSGAGRDARQPPCAPRQPPARLGAAERLDARA